MSFSKPAYHPSNLNSLGVDLETAALIAKLALEDLQESAYGRRWGKSKVGITLSDEAYAYQLQAQQFQEWLTVAEDARLAVSLNDASESDAAYLDAIATAELAARDDRNAALALSSGLPLPPPTSNQTRLEDPTFMMDPEPKPKYEFRCVLTSIELGLSSILVHQMGNLRLLRIPTMNFQIQTTTSLQQQSMTTP